MGAISICAEPMGTLPEGTRGAVNRTDLRVGKPRSLIRDKVAEIAIHPIQGG